MSRRRLRSSWAFPPLHELTTEDDLVAIGADLEPATLITAYRSGYFPMPLERNRLGWFSPVERGIIVPDELRVSRSLRRSIRRFEVTHDRAFAQVIQGCADPRRDHGWIDRQVVNAYSALHKLGHAHSIEVWHDGVIVGGLYGVSIGGFFAGESMFHHQTDASKVALVSLIDHLGTDDHVLLDVQWLTPHLASLGARAVPRLDYGRRLAQALHLPQPASFRASLLQP